MGQEAVVFRRYGYGRIEDWQAVEAPARRRRWFDDGEGTLAVLLASTSDLDDLLPTLVAYQVEWNKLHAAARGSRAPARAPSPTRPPARRRSAGAEDDWIRIRESWDGSLAALPRRGPRPPAEPAHPHARRQPGRLRARDPPLDGPAARGDARPGADRPPAVLRLLEPALDGQPAHRHRPRARAGDRAASSTSTARTTCARSSRSSARGAPRARGRTSSTTARACTTRAGPRTARSGRSASTTSARPASPTSPAAPRCASPRS